MTITTSTKPAFIWDQATLQGLLEHQTATIREWAASHILELYPEATAQVLGLLPDVSDGVAEALLHDLRGKSLPDEAIEPVRQYLHQERPTGTRAEAAAMLLCKGVALPEEDLAPLPMNIVMRDLAATEPGFEYLLQTYQGDAEPADGLAEAVALGCGAEDLLWAMSETSGRRRRRITRDLADRWQVRLPAIHKADDRDQALALLQSAVDSPNEATTGVAVRFPDLLAQLQQAEERIDRLLVAVVERQHNGLSPPDDEVQLLLAAALAVHRDGACLASLAAGPQPRDLWRCLSLRPWRADQIDREVLAILADWDPDELLSALQEELGAGWAFCTYPFQVLEELDVSGRYWHLVATTEGAYGEALQDEATEFEEQMFTDPKAVESLLETWRERPPENPDLLHLLGRCPTQEAVQFLLDHFDEYMSTPNSQHLVDVARDIASPVFVRPLAEEWREGEAEIADAVWHVAVLHGMEDDDAIQRIPRPLGRYRPILHALIGTDAVQGGPDRKAVVFPLRCTTCKRTYHYDLDRVIVGKRKPEVAIGQIVECKGCGSLGSQEVTDETVEAISVETIRINLLEKMRGSDVPVETPLVTGSVKIKAAGRTFTDLTEAYHHLVGAVEQEPDNAELRMKLGNVLHTGLRSDLAAPHFEASLRLAPKSIDAAYALAAAMVAQDRHREAAPHLERLAQLCRDPELDEDLCRELYPALAAMAQEVQESAGIKVDFLSPPRNIPGPGHPVGGPVTLDLVELDIDDPEDVERAFQVFRNGISPRSVAAKGRDDVGVGPWEPAEPVRKALKVGRNEPCPCGSGKKHKRCCGK